MAVFDQLQRISAGQYLPLDSPLHRLDPRAKILSVFILMIAITLTRSLMGLAAALVFTYIFLSLSGISAREVLKKLRVPLPVILILALLQLFITPHKLGQSPVFTWWILSIYPPGILAAALLFTRFIALVWLLTLGGVTISRLEMIYGFDLLFKPLQKLGVRTDSLTLVLQMMLRFIPYLVFNAEKIARSQAARGANWDDPKGGLLRRAKQVLPVILPLFTIGLRQADILATAMVARGYGISNARTGLREYRFSWKDALFVLLCVAVAFFVVRFP